MFKRMRVFSALASICLVSASLICAEESQGNTNFFIQSLNTVRHPKSCLQFLRDGASESGFYQIFDNEDNRHTVYCDFTSEPGSAWTLVLSHAKERRCMMQFRTFLLGDSPVNEKTANWQAYRMSLAMMQSVASRSTHWRYTCSFPQHGVDYHDYARAKFSALDPLTFDEDGKCVKMDYVNIRGNACAQCEAQWWQPKSSKRILHMDSYKTRCEFKAQKGAIQWEDNFGFYENANVKFRCTTDESSTTNLWFGGYL